MRMGEIIEPAELPIKLVGVFLASDVRSTWVVGSRNLESTPIYQD